MRHRISYEAQLKKDLRLFVNIILNEAINCQVNRNNIKDKPTKNITSGPSTSHPNKENNFGTKKVGTKQDVSPKEKAIWITEEKKKTGIRQYFCICKECVKEVKDGLFENNRNKRNQVAKRTVDHSKDELK